LVVQDLGCIDDEVTVAASRALPPAFTAALGGGAPLQGARATRRLHVVAPADARPDRQHGRLAGGLRRRRRGAVLDVAEVPVVGEREGRYRYPLPRLAQARAKVGSRKTKSRSVGREPGERRFFCFVGASPRNSE
jgi:hypothetical protein